MKQTKENSSNKSWNIGNTLILIIALASITFCIYNYYLIKKSKIACIDTSKIIKSYNEIESLSKSFEEKRKTFNSRLDTLKSEFENNLKEFEKKRPGLTSNEVRNEENKLRRKQQEYAQFDASNQEKLKAEEGRVIERAVTRINEKIKRYAKVKGYSVVFGGTNNGNIIYVTDYVDITEDIIAIIND